MALAQSDKILSDATRLSLQAFFRTENWNMPFRLFVLITLATLFYFSTKAAWPLYWVAIGIPLELAFYLWTLKTRPKLQGLTDFTQIRVWNDGLTFIILASWTVGTTLFYLEDVPGGATAALLIFTGIGTNLAYQPGRYFISSFINAAVPSALIIGLSILDVNAPGGWLQLLVGILISGAIFILVVQTRQANTALYLSHAQQAALIDALARAHDEADNKRRDAESLARAKADFITVMSHEVRTPLNGVLAMAETLSRSKLDREQNRQVATIADSGRLLLNIVSNILDLSRNDAGHMQLEKTVVDLKSLIDPGLDLWRNRASANGLSFTIEQAKNVPRYIEADYIRLRQILFNLIENAIKFTKKGEIALHILREGVQTKNDRLRFLVSDTGIGIDPVDHKRIFGRFVKIEKEAARNSNGAGLGLAIVDELVKLMGGEVTVESIAGKGSIFSFTIPCDIADPPKAVITEDTSQKTVVHRQMPHDNPATPRFLIVDDNIINHRVLDATLAPYKSENVMTMSGEEALQAFKEQGPFHLIFMDMRMPGMDGVEAIRHIRAMENGPRTPILALTANVNPSDEHACLDAGADAYLTKPLDINRLYELVLSLTGYSHPESRACTKHQEATPTD